MYLHILRVNISLKSVYMCINAYQFLNLYMHKGSASLEFKIQLYFPQESLTILKDTCS